MSEKLVQYGCTSASSVTEMNLMQTLNTIISVIENSEENMLNEINQKDKIFCITGFLSIQDEDSNLIGQSSYNEDHKTVHFDSKSELINNLSSFELLNSNVTYLEIKHEILLKHNIQHRRNKPDLLVSTNPLCHANKIYEVGKSK